MIIGDSITRRLPEEYLPGVVNLGKDGDIVSGVEGRLRFDPPGRGDTMLIAVGINDLMRREPWHVLRDYDHLLRSMPPVRRVIVSAALPMTGNRFDDPERLNRRIAQFDIGLRLLAWWHNVDFVDARPAVAGNGGWLRPDFTDDGVHLGPTGNAAWAAVLWRILNGESQQHLAICSDRTGP